MAGTILEVNGLTRSFGGFSLDGVSFSVPAGSIMGFVGENGAGKTTTIKLILNLIRRDAGTVTVAGLDNLRDEQKVKEITGVVFDENRFHEGFTTVWVGKVLSGMFPSWDGALYQKYCAEFSLPEKKDIKEFSRGMKMKLAIAAALARRPRLLLLDEATSGLDPIVRNEILDILLEFIQNEECGVLFSTHITSDLERIADYITFLHEGKLVFSKTKDELLYDYGILKCGSADFGRIEKADILRSKKTANGYEVLVAKKREMAAKYRDFVIDRTTIEDIMLFYAGRGLK